MTYRTEFPDFDNATVAEQLLAAGFVDHSWHNDSCPAFYLNDRAVLYVNYRDPAKREQFADDVVEPEFWVYTLFRNDSGEVDGMSDDAETFDDIDSALAAARRIAALSRDDIQAAVRSGATVHWMNVRYRVVCDRLGQWLVTCQNGATVGLESHASDGFAGFYIAASE